MPLPEPYFEQDGIVLYHGDCREILPWLGPAGVTVTDPVWPNGGRIFPETGDPWELWAEVAPMLTEMSERLVVILGCDSDPRFLYSIPEDYPFVRTCRLRFSGTSYKGTILVDADQAYVFGSAFTCGDGKHRVLPGEARAKRRGLRPRLYTRPGGGRPAVKERAGHPSPRHPDHMIWLVENFTRPDDLVLDPFAGIGTTLWACRELGRRAVGIEVNEQWCQDAVDVLRQRVMFPPEEPRGPQERDESPSLLFGEHVEKCSEGGL